MFRDKVNHLLDIDGDLCHRIDNAVKYFYKAVGKYLVSLWWDIRNYFKFSANIKAALPELCLILDLNYRKPSEVIIHRWLLVYTPTINNLPMYDAFFLMYCSRMIRKIKLSIRMGKYTY